MLESRWQPFLPLFLLPLWPIAAFCTVHVGWSNRFCHALLNCFLSAEGAYTFLHVSMAVCSAPLLKFFFSFYQTRIRNVSVSHHNFKIWKTCAQMCVYAQVCGIVPAHFFYFFYHGFLFLFPHITNLQQTCRCSVPMRRCLAGSPFSETLSGICKDKQRQQFAVESASMIWDDF